MWGQMRLLWFSHFVPFPPKGGAHQRSFNLIRHASSSHEISLVAFNLQQESRERLAEHSRELKKYCDNVEFWELPVQWRCARWWAGLALSPLFRDPYGCRALWSRQLAARWQQIIHRHQGALVHFDSIDLGLYARTVNGCRTVLNHHNCESAMTYRRAQRESNPIKKAYLRLLARQLARLEQVLCHRFDVNTAVCELDARQLRAGNPKAHIHVVENGTDTEYFAPTRDPVEPMSLIFAGTMNWYPNVSAVRFFVREIWPLIKQRCPNVRLYLAGNSPSRSLIRWLEQDPKIVLVASPDDIRPWLARAAVFVCPILDGGGTRLKILDALAMGKPVVTTTIASEGLRVRHEEHILAADAPRDFAREVLRALQDERLRNRLGAAGRALVERYYTWERIALQLEQAYRCALTAGGCNQQQIEPFAANS